MFFIYMKKDLISVLCFNNIQVTSGEEHFLPAQRFYTLILPESARHGLVYNLSPLFIGELQIANRSTENVDGGINKQLTRCSS